MYSILIICYSLLKPHESSLMNRQHHQQALNCMSESLFDSLETKD